MSLLPNRRAVHPAQGDVPSGAAPLARGAYRPPLRLLPRLVLFLTLTIIFHGFATFIVSQVVRAYPSLILDNPSVGTLLCGEGTTLRLDFSPPGPGRPRGLANWIVCLDGDGRAIRDAGTIAALLSGLVLTIPFAMVMFGIILRMNRRSGGSPSVPVRMRSEPVDWTSRLIFGGAGLLVAAMVAGGAAAWITQYRPATILESRVAARLACGPERRLTVVQPYTRGRRLGCLDAAGREDMEAGRLATVRLLAPLFLLIAVPALWLVSRIRTIRRGRRAVPGD